jgi:hypothetical protein
LIDNGFRGFSVSASRFFCACFLGNCEKEGLDRNSLSSKSLGESGFYRTASSQKRRPAPPAKAGSKPFDAIDGFRLILLKNSI